MNFNIQYTVYTYILIRYTGYIILYQIMMLNDVKGKHSSLQICIHVELHTHTISPLYLTQNLPTGYLAVEEN